ncbi:hypothetical protein EAH87_16320 [Sphingomonas koreensis]|nr:hypothetical protein EAH87_16320 [Sphingomonas koreensis]
MTEAKWGDTAKTPKIDWRMSASLENVERGDGEMAEVTSLEGAVRAWLDLDPTHRTAAILTPERAVQIDGVSANSFTGDGIIALSERLPDGPAETG